MAKNIYSGYAQNDQGCTEAVNFGETSGSIAQIAKWARGEFGGGWTIHIMHRDIDGDGKSYMGETEVKSFTIRY